MYVLPSFSRSLLTWIVAAIFAVSLAGPATAGGLRSIEFEPIGGLPVAGVEHRFIVRLLEDGDHGVDGARVTLIAGIGGSHDEHSLPSGGSEEYAEPFEVAAVPGGTPGEYEASATFPTEGMWTVWIVADEGDVPTEASWMVSVVANTGTAGAGALGDTPAATGSSTPDGSVEPIADEPAGATGVAPAITAGDDGHADSDDGGHGAADATATVNWWVIGGFFALVSAAWAHATWLKRRLRAAMASGRLVDGGVRS